MVEPVIQTYTGRLVNPTVFSPSDWNVVDVAESLSWVFRWGGASQRRISVAQHSMLVSELARRLAVARGATDEVAAVESLTGLLHDASEYLLHDICAPLKHQSGMFGEYLLVEEHIQRTIYDLHGLPGETSLVKEVDLLARYLERSQLFDYHHVSWAVDPPPNLPQKVKVPHFGTATPDVVAQQFVRRYEHLVNVVGG